MSTMKILCVISSMIFCANAYAVGEQGGMSIDNFKSNVNIRGAVTQVTLDDHNTSELGIGSARGNVTMKTFESNVNVRGAVTQATIGSHNDSSLLIGSVSSH